MQINDLCCVLLEMSEKVCGHTKGRMKHKETWWWNEEVAKAVKEKRRQLKVWKKSKSDVDRQAYSEAKRAARAEIAKAQETGRKDFVNMLDKAEEKGQSSKADCEQEKRCGGRWLCER
jgi:RNA polymerase-interacting CarD/CdnL/TRCF family regulator